MPRKRTERLGSEQARRIAEECYGEVLAYCRRHAPVGHEPADLAQETFLRFVRAGSYCEPAKLTVGILSAATVLVGAPTVHASKLHGVAELEYSCPNNVASVMVARLVVLGCSSALAVLLMVFVTAAYLDLGAFAVALWATPPFFCSCAGCLFALRKVAPLTGAAFCVVWSAACSAALLALSAHFPEMYSEASLVVWAGAAAAALAWLAREVAMTLRSALQGLDAFSPYMAKTYN